MEQKPKILLVDDEPNFLAGMRRLLQCRVRQWQVHCVGSVDEALARLRDEDFDAVVADVCMPGKDGFTLLQLLRRSESTRGIPVIMLTGRDDETMKRRALDLGATDLLAKPVQREDLVARVGNVLRIKAYQDELKGYNEELTQRVRDRTAALEQSRLDVILRLGKAAEYRDEETGNHILRVGCYCRVLAEELGMTEDFAEMVYLAGPLHDIGKIGVPDSILLKPGPLTAEERRLMERHCVIGYEILLHDPKSMQRYLAWGGRDAPRSRAKDNPVLQVAATITSCHHEKWDGTGYPQQLAGQDIPLPARIAALADVYDALRAVRPYKPAFSEEDTCAIIRQQAGAHFDPLVVRAFEKQAALFESLRSEFSHELRDPAPAPAQSIPGAPPAISHPPRR